MSVRKVSYKLFKAICYTRNLNQVHNEVLEIYTFPLIQYNMNNTKCTGNLGQA